MNHWFLSQISTDSLVLTANRRLADAIRQAVAQVPTVLPLRSWLADLWGSHPSGYEKILTDFQEHCLWSQIIQKSAAAQEHLLNINNTAQSAQQAWRLWQEWQIPVEAIPAHAESAETSVFMGWAEQFMEACSQNGWLSEAALPQRLLQALPSHSFDWPRQIFVTGFDELPPVYRALLDLFQCYTTVTEINELPPPAESKALTFSDLTTEITTMARWAKMQRELHPEKTIACVVPELMQCREQVVSIFNQIAGRSAYNISAGQTLNQFSMISAALQALEFGFGKLTPETLSECLQSPYLSLNEADRNMGALSDAQLRKTNRFEYGISDLFNVITCWQTHYPENTWLTRWREFLKISAELSGLHLPSIWIAHFMRQLQSLGWPGGRTLNSLEYQLSKRWTELCGELTALDAHTGLITQREAYRLLRDLTHRTIFQPQTPPESPRIQILGVLESSGLFFDAAWVMGLNENHWPATARPNPYLPYSLQIEMQMPHASAHRELQYAQRIAKRLLRSARCVRISASSAQPDQKPQLSALFKTIPMINVSALQLPPLNTPAKIIFDHSRKEIFQDDQTTAVSPSEKIHGGSAVLTRQAECPFRAFATFRLDAIALQKPELGISPKERGILVHAALEKIWEHLKNQNALLEMPDNALQSLIEKTADDVIRENLKGKIPSIFLNIEKTRTIALIADWLAIEKERPSFSVAAQETEYSVSVGELKLRIKIDRLDQLRDGSLMMIDYKTGKPDLKSWLGERIQQPQLPLYCAYSEEKNLTAAAFAQLSANKMSFSGIHAGSDLADSLFPNGVKALQEWKENDAPETWDELLEQWRRALLKLSEDFCKGRAGVDPADHGKPCKTCDLQPLCRIQTYPE